MHSNNMEWQPAQANGPVNWRNQNRSALVDAVLMPVPEVNSTVLSHPLMTPRSISLANAAATLAEVGHKQTKPREPFQGGNDFVLGDSDQFAARLLQGMDHFLEPQGVCNGGALRDRLVDGTRHRRVDAGLEARIQREPRLRVHQGAMSARVQMPSGCSRPRMSAAAARQEARSRRSNRRLPSVPAAQDRRWRPSRIRTLGSGSQDGSPHSRRCR